MTTWTLDDIPDLRGRRALVTGVTGGLGGSTVLQLARRGAMVIATARDEHRGAAALDAVRAQLPNAALELLVVDLADLSSVRSAAAQLRDTYDRIDMAVTNAGVMATPQRTTVDGFELQVGTNHLGHFALIGGLWPLLAAADARIVAVSSLMHRTVGGIRSTSLQPGGASAGRYRKWRAYGESKLANLVWAMELDRRVHAAGIGITAVAAHPGFSATNLQQAGLAMGGARIERLVLGAVTRLVSQPAAAGAEPLGRAATEPGLAGGSFVGPSGPGEMRGAPVLVGMSRVAADPATGEELWRLSEQATGVHYP